MIDFGKYKLVEYDSNKNEEILIEIRSNSKSRYINDIDNKLFYNGVNNSIFGKAYLVALENSIIGVVYLSGIKNNSIYLEYLIIRKYRNQGYATDVVSKLSDYIFYNFKNVLSIHLSIDKSNIASINVAEKSNFILEEDSYLLDKLEFIKENTVNR